MRPMEMCKSLDTSSDNHDVRCKSQLEVGVVSAGRAEVARRFALPSVLPRKAYAAALIGVVITGAGCGGGGGGGAAPPVVVPPPPPVMVLAVTSPRARQGLTGEALLAFRVAIDGTKVAYPLSIGFTLTSTANVGLSCTAGVNYYVATGSGVSVSVGTPVNTANGQLTMASNSSNRQINVMVCPGNSLTDTAIQFAWNAGPSAGAAVGTLLGAGNTDVANRSRLNDTGVTSCGNANSNNLSCPLVGFPRQDAESGRDANLAITGSGNSRTSAFEFTALLASIGIQDNVTGLVWEGKTSDGGLHDRNATFTWLNNGSAVNGGAAGTASGGSCSGLPAGCDTEKFIAAVNAEALYGFTDWRLPTAQELSMLVHSGATSAPTIDPLLANQIAGEYWSATPKAADPAGAWLVDFNSGAVVSSAKSSAKRVRLVRGR